MNVEKLNKLIANYEDQRMIFEFYNKDKDNYAIVQISRPIGEIAALDLELAFHFCEQLMEHIHDWDTNHAWGYSIQCLCKKNTIDKVSMMIASNPQMFKVYFNESVVCIGQRAIIGQYIKMGRMDLADSALELIYSNKNYPGRGGEDDRFFDTLGSIIHHLVFYDGIDNLEFLLHWTNKIKEKKDRAYALIAILNLIKDINEKNDVFMEVFKLAKNTIKYEDETEVSTLIGQAGLIDLDLAIEIWSYYLQKSKFEKEFNSNKIIDYLYIYTRTTDMIFEELLKTADFYLIMKKVFEKDLLKKMCISPGLFKIQCQFISECMRKRDYVFAGKFIEGIFSRIEIYEQDERFHGNKRFEYIVEVLSSLSEIDESTYHFLISMIDRLNDELEIAKAKVFIARFLESSSEREKIYFESFETLKDNYESRENRVVLDIIVEVANYDVSIALKMLEYRIFHFDRKEYELLLYDYDRIFLDTLEKVYSIRSEMVVEFILSNPLILKLTFQLRYTSKLHNKLVTDFLNLKKFDVAERALTMIKPHPIEFHYGKFIRYIIVNSHLNKQDKDIKRFLYNFIQLLEKKDEREKAYIKSYFKDVDTK